MWLNKCFDINIHLLNTYQIYVFYFWIFFEFIYPFLKIELNLANTLLRRYQSAIIRFKTNFGILWLEVWPVGHESVLNIYY